MTKYERLPIRKFYSPEKVAISISVDKKIYRDLEVLAETWGWIKQDLIVTAFDLYMQAVAHASEKPVFQFDEPLDFASTLVDFQIPKKLKEVMQNYIKRLDDHNFQFTDLAELIIRDYVQWLKNFGSKRPSS